MTVAPHIEALPVMVPRTGTRGSVTRTATTLRRLDIRTIVEEEIIATRGPHHSNHAVTATEMATATAVPRRLRRGSFPLLLQTMMIDAAASTRVLDLIVLTAMERLLGITARMTAALPTATTLLRCIVTAGQSPKTTPLSNTLQRRSHTLERAIRLSTMDLIIATLVAGVERMCIEVGEGEDRPLVDPRTTRVTPIIAEIRLLLDREEGRRLPVLPTVRSMTGRHLRGLRLPWQAVVTRAGVGEEEEEEEQGGITLRTTKTIPAMVEVEVEGTRATTTTAGSPGMAFISTVQAAIVLITKKSRAMITAAGTRPVVVELQPVDLGISGINRPIYRLRVSRMS